MEKGKAVQRCQKCQWAYVRCHPIESTQKKEQKASVGLGDKDGQDGEKERVALRSPVKGFV
jgi:hypothetical protein